MKRLFIFLALIVVLTAARLHFTDAPNDPATVAIHAEGPVVHVSDRVEARTSQGPRLGDGQAPLIPIESAVAVPPPPLPDWFRAVEPGHARSTGSEGEWSIKGRPSATPERAKVDARKVLDQAVAEWVAPDASKGWRAPEGLVGSMIRQTVVESIKKDYGTVYVTGFKADFSESSRERLIQARNHEIATHRLTLCGGGLAFLLTCLAGVSGYIRTDEATKGYYTNPLRLAAAAGVGGAGVLIYQLLH